MQQLDIFDDGSDTLLRNALAEALQADDAAAAWHAQRALAADFPQDRLLPAAAALIGWLESPNIELGAAAAVTDDGAAVCAKARTSADSNTGGDAWRGACSGAGKAVETGASHDAAITHAAAAHARLAGPLQRAAVDVPGPPGARTWLARRWREQAVACRGLAFTPAQPDSHAAACWLRVGDAPAAQQAVLAIESIESWRRKPQPLAWMAQARLASAGLDACWPLLAELAWMAPQRLPVLVAELAAAGEPRPARLARRFEDAFDDDPGTGTGTGTGLGWRWWPAWLLVEQPLLAPVLGVATPGHAEDGDHGERGFRVMLALLRHERLGEHRERTAARRVLQGLCPALFAAYMATR